jgi:hypothetical protein
MFVGMPILAVALLAADGASVDAARESLAKWGETRKLLFQERSAWEQGREVLKSRIELANKEITDLESKLRDARAAAAETRGKQSAIRSETARFDDLSARLEAEVGRLEADLRSLQPGLPPFVLEKIDPLIRRIPEPGKPAKSSVAERFQNVLGILNEIHKANSEITVATEVRALSDGKPSEVRTVYVGLGQAYYLSARGEAGVGRPGSEGWVWQPANELSGNILQVLDILQAKGKPAFIPLPVQIR